MTATQRCSNTSLHLLLCAQGRTEFSMEKLTDDVVGVIRHLGYEKCVLVGHGEGSHPWPYSSSNHQPQVCA